MPKIGKKTIGEVYLNPRHWRFEFTSSRQNSGTKASFYPIDDK
jgi:hypothetical protein